MIKEVIKGKYGGEIAVCVCDYCGEEFKKGYQNATRVKHNFCNRKCNSLYKKHETEIKLSSIKFKKCSGCRTVKPVTEFDRRGEGFKSRCKKCRKIKRKTYDSICSYCGNNTKVTLRQYKQNNKFCNWSHYLLFKKENQKHTTRQEYDKYYYKKNKEKRLQQAGLYLKQNRGKINQAKNRYYHNIQKKNFKFRINGAIGAYIRKHLNGNKNGKHWENLLGYTLEDLKNCLENQFKPGMSWNNYGNWHIDHKIPISFFEFRSHKDTEFKLCWCLGNLQPLWAKENISKNGNLVDKYIKDVRLTNEV
jgi:hypothetical protein